MKKIFMRQRGAFTMIELIFVTVILGIVASIGSEVIANVYKNYILQRATHRASLKTELAAQQIANMLSYRIPGTTLARNPKNLLDTVYVADSTYANDINHTILEWIGEDSDGFSAGLPPAWDGFCDVAASSQTAIRTPGSKLSKEYTIVSNLSGSATPPNPAIFFRSKHYSYNSSTSASVEYNASCMGMITSDRSCISSVVLPSSAANDENLTFSYQGSANKKVIAEHYKLAWTAYAIVPYASDGSGPCDINGSTGNFNKLCDLRLYYNYQPWNGTRLNIGSASNTPPHSTLITKVSVFKFAEAGNTFRFKICAQENIGEDYNITICKEKAVVR